MASDDNIVDINYKLIAIQAKLKAPKGQYNSFGKYNYRSAEDILEAVKPLCHAEKVALVLTDKPVLVGSRVYIEATAILIDAVTDDKIEVTAYAREPDEKKGMDESQITGTASSYARKYALNGLFCIDDTKDADTDEYHKQTARPESKTTTQPEASDKTKAEAELTVNKFEDLASEGYISQDSLANMKNAYGKLKSEKDYRSFINNCNKNIAEAEKKKAAEPEKFDDDQIPF